MGLFGKKKVFTEGVIVEFYDGDLEGFTTNMPCNILLKEGTLQIKRANPDITVNLDISRITKIDIFWKESDYMLKYKGHAVSTSKSNLEKTYFVIYYSSKSGESKHLDFWCVTKKEISYVQKIQEELFLNQEQKTYEI